MTTNIERQEMTVTALVRIMSRDCKGTQGLRLSNVRRFHIRKMKEAGYSEDEAIASAWECMDIARLQVNAK